MSTVPPTEPPYVAPAGAAAKSPILSILALVGGGLGVLSCGYGAIFGIAGIVLGVLGRKKEPNGKGLALAGIILGAVSLVLGAIWVVVYVLSFAAAASYSGYTG